MAWVPVTWVSCNIYVVQEYGVRILLINMAGYSIKCVASRKKPLYDANARYMFVSPQEWFIAKVHPYFHILEQYHESRVVRSYTGGIEIYGIDYALQHGYSHIRSKLI